MRASEKESRNGSGLRPEIVIITFSAVIGLSLVLAVASRAVHRTPPTEISNTASQSQSSPPDNAARPLITSHPPEPGAVEPIAPTPQSVSVEQQISDLDETINGDNPDDQKLNTVLAALENPEKKVRAAALEDVLTLDNRDAIPRLQQLAANTDSADEKQALLDAADHLALPSLTEYRAEHPSSGKVKPRAAGARKNKNTLPPQQPVNGAQAQ
jgi:hypothetical protein